MKTFPGSAFAAAFTPDSAMAVVAGSNLAIYDVTSGALISSYADSGSHYQKAVATTPDGQAFLRSGWPGQIYSARLPLWISSHSQADGSAFLSWIGSGTNYQVQQRTNLIDGTWQNVGEVITNKTAEVPLQCPNAFYRVIGVPN
jgi:hypothetical protein